MDENVRRSIRSTAGNRYQSLLASEDTDEFYESHYGGFTDIKSDDDFRSESSSSDETITESSANEDESEKEGEEPEKERKKKKLVYKDPANKKSKVKKERKSDKSKKETNVSTSAESRRSSRKQVIEQRHELEQTLKHREMVEKKRKTKKNESKRMTQEEIMAEAKKTEEINLSQLVIYQQMEQQRKNKSRRKKAKTISGPTVKVILKSPLINPILEISPNFGSSLKTENKEVERQTQNLVIFSNRETYDKIFTHKKPIPPHKERCVITGKPARYRTRDNIPYHDMAAFKQIRAQRVDRPIPMETN